MKRCIPCLLSDHGPADVDPDDILEDEEAPLCEDPKHNPPGQDMMTKRPILSNYTNLSREVS